MRMRFLALGLAAIMILTGCKADTPIQSGVVFYTGAWVGGGPVRIDDGILQLSDEKGMQFFDFETFQTVSICARPNCSHDASEKNCTAHGLPQSVCYYNDKLYYAVSSTNITTDGKRVDVTEIYTCSRDGSNRQKLASVDEVAISYYGLYMLEGNRLYIILARPDEVFNEKTGISEYMGDKAADLYCYDIGERDLIKVSSFYEGYEVSVSPLGYDTESGILYYYLSYSKERTMGANFTDEEILEKREYKFMKMDINTGETSQWSHIPSSSSVHSVYKGYALFTDRKDAGDTMRIKKMNIETGEESFITEFPVFTFGVTEDKIFMREAGDYSPGDDIAKEEYRSLENKQYYFDLKKDKLIQISEFRSGYSLSTSILSSYKDMYIVRVVDISNPDQQVEYMAKIKKTDYLKGEMNFIATYDGAIY